MLGHGAVCGEGEEEEEGAWWCRRKEEGMEGGKEEGKGARRGGAAEQPFRGAGGRPEPSLPGLPPAPGSGGRKRAIK